MEKSHIVPGSSKRKRESVEKENQEFKSLKSVPKIWKLML
jgi:hypothetical protein